MPDEVIADKILIRADKNPNTAGAQALFGAAATRFDPDTDLVLVWGEGCDFGQLPPRARIIYLNAWLQPENGHADVFLPISVQTERSGHYTNCEGVASRFAACFTKQESVADAEALFAALATPARSGP
jgi:NADH-quinone oxidoreductase subunit G